MVSSAYFENKNINYLQATHFSFHGTNDAMGSRKDITIVD